VDIAVIVSSFERPGHLERCLASLEAQRGVAGRFEVVVTDDGSRDDTLQFLARTARRVDFPLSFTTHDHDGFRLARCRNEGVAASTAPYLLFTDGDCILPPDHLLHHLRARRPGRVVAGDCLRLAEVASATIDAASLRAGRFPRPLPAGERWRLTVKGLRAKLYEASRTPGRPRLSGNNIGIWRTDYERVNGFDERFVGWGQEDDDLGLRLRAVGVRLESVLDLTASLHVWHPTDPSATVRWRDGANVPYFTRRGRLAACRRGLASRRIEDVRWGLPADAASSPLGRLLQRRLAAAPRSPPGVACEVEVVVHPGRRFVHPAECRLLLVPPDTLAPRRLTSRADRIGVVTSADDLEAILEDVG